MLLLLSADFFKKFFQENYVCVNGLDPDQAQGSGSKLFGNVIRGSKKSPLAKERVNPFLAKPRYILSIM